MDWKKELKERLGVIEEIAAAGLDDMEGYEVLDEQHLTYLEGNPPKRQDISKGFFQAVRDLNPWMEMHQEERPVNAEGGGTSGERI